MADEVSIRFRAEIFEEGDDYVAICPELDVSSFGDSVAEAEESLREAVEAFVEVTSVTDSPRPELQDHSSRARSLFTISMVRSKSACGDSARPEMAS